MAPSLFMMVSFEGSHGGDYLVICDRLLASVLILCGVSHGTGCLRCRVSGSRTNIAGEKHSRIRIDPVDLKLLNSIQLPFSPATLRAWHTVHIECFSNGQVFSGGVRRGWLNSASESPNCSSRENEIKTDRSKGRKLPRRPLLAENGPCRRKSCKTRDGTEKLIPATHGNVTPKQIVYGMIYTEIE